MREQAAGDVSSQEGRSVAASAAALRSSASFSGASCHMTVNERMAGMDGCRVLRLNHIAPFDKNLHLRVISDIFSLLKRNDSNVNLFCIVTV